MEVVVGDYNGEVAGLHWDIYDSESKNHSGSVKVLSAVDDYFTSGSTDESIRLYNISKRIELGTLMHHNGSITALEFAAKSHLLSAAEDGLLTIWKCKSWECMKNFKGHKSAISCLAVHPSNTMAMTASKDKTIRVWNLVTGRPSFVVNSKEDVPFIGWSPSGQLYALVVKNTVYIYELKTASFVHKLDFQNRITSMQFISENVIAIAGDATTLKLYDISNETCLLESEKLPSRIKSMKVCSTPSAIVTALSDGYIKIWKYESNSIKEVISQKTHMRLTSICCLLKDINS